jgi:hypothetical protein
MYPNQKLLDKQKRVQAENADEVLEVSAHIVRKQNKCSTDEPARVETRVNSYSLT